MGWLSDLMAQNDPFEEEYQKKLYIKSFPSDLVEAMSTPPSIPEPEPLQFLPENVEIARQAGLGPVPGAAPIPEPAQNPLLEALNSMAAESSAPFVNPRMDIVNAGLDDYQKNIGDSELQQIQQIADLLPEPGPKDGIYTRADKAMGGVLPFGVPIQREEGFPGMEDFVGAGPEAPPVFPDDPVMKARAQGYGDLAQIAGGAARWLGNKELGDKWVQAGQKLAEENQFSPGTPGAEGFGLKMVRSMPLTEALLPLGFAGGAIGSGIAGLAKLGTLGRGLAATGGAVALSRPAESLMEAGGVYNEALAQGMSESQAAEAAKETFLKNLPLAATDFVEIGAAFLGAKVLPKPLRETIEKALETRFGRNIIDPAIKIATPILMEGEEENIQQIAQQQALGDDRGFFEQYMNPTEAQQEARLLGQVMGGTMGGAGVVANIQAGQEQPVQEDNAYTPPPLQTPVIEPVSYSGPVLGNIERPAGGAPIPQTAIPTPAIPPVSTPAAETQGVADETGQAGVIVPAGEVNVPQTGGKFVEGVEEAAPVTEKQPWEMTQKEYTQTVRDGRWQLVGSRARGDATETSDKDYLTVLTQEERDVFFSKDGIPSAKRLPQEILDRWKQGRKEDDFLVAVPTETGHVVYHLTGTPSRPNIYRVSHEKGIGYLGKKGEEEAPDARSLLPKDFTLDVPAGLSHEAAIRKALSEGKPVPPEVLADYPDLAQQTEQKPVQQKAPAQEVAPQLEATTTSQPEKNATPARVRNIFRGKHGSVRVEFPDSIHADLFAFPSKLKKAAREGGNIDHEVKRLKHWLRLGEEDNLAAVAQEYHERVMEGVKDLPEKETYKAPKRGEKQEQTGQPAAPSVKMAEGDETVKEKSNVSGGRPENGQKVKITAYHGTGRDFVEFDKNQIGSHQAFGDDGFFFITDKAEAEWYANENTKLEDEWKPAVITADVTLENPLVVDAADDLNYSNPTNYFDFYANKLYNKARRGKYDGIVVNGTNDYDGVQLVVAFEPYQIDIKKEPNESTPPPEEAGVEKKIKANEQQAKPPEPEVSDVPTVEALKAYASEVVKTGEIKSVTLVGSAAVKGKIPNDIDLLYYLGDRDLPNDSEWAAQEVEEIIESLKAPIDTESYDTFIQLGDRFFHISSGAGRAVVENTSYAKEQLGKPTVVLAEMEAKETPSVTLADYGLTIKKGVTNNGKPVWEVTGETKQYKDYFNKMGARWYGPKKSWSFYTEEDPTAKILAKLPKLEKKEEVTAKPEAKEQPTQPKYGRAGNAAYKKWGENEYVNAKLDDLSDPYTQAYRKFFEAYYNAGLSGNKPRFDDSIKQELLKSGHYFPPFLEDVFYQAGAKDAEAKSPLQTGGRGGKLLAPTPKQESTATKQPADMQKESLQTGQDSGNVEEKGHWGPHVRIAEFVAQKLKSKEKFTSADLFREADKAYGGGQAQGKYTPKDAYDALELGVNKYLEDQLVIDSTLDAEHARSNLKSLEGLLELLPTQTKRTAEQDEFQQFSTPPNLAYVAAWAANFSKGDTVLEPSAGIGGLAVFAKKAGAEVAVNELSKRRLELLKEMGFDEVFNEDAEQIDNILPDSVKPTVVIMNPPFSATAGRMQGVRSTKFAEAHIGQALSRLEPDGRLVAIVGRGMSDSAATFRDWWKKIKAEYNVRANIGIDGSNYKKYGTSFDVQLLVIDKTGATPEGATITGSVTKLEDVLPLLEVVRNDRTANRPAQQAAGEPTGKKASQAGEAEAGPGSPVSISIAEVGAGERGSEKPGGRESTRERGPSGRGGASAAAEPAESDGLSVEGRPGGRESVGEAGTAGEVEETSGRGGVSAGQDESSTGRKRAEPESGIKVESQEAQTAGEELTDAVFTAYTPQKLKIPGAKQHPGHLAQSAAMAAVEPPTPTYAPNLPKEVIKEGKLSIAQLESIVYAGQAHQQTLPNGQRRGFFIGDGTGVGKGREISGIILDNMRQGRKKAVWISKNNPLFADAKRDFGDIGGNTDLLFELGKIKQGMPVKQKEGVIFTTYNTLSQNLEVSRDGELAIKKDKQARIDQIVNWLGKDFDGVIAFDEAHHMQNSLAMKGKRGMTKPSAMALAGVELQKRLPNARIVYVSATGATEVANLAYASRLGLWGEGTAFADNRDFVSQVQAGGLATMELVARDMKAMGAYLARSLSFDGVTYGTIQHELSGEQLEIYDAMAEGWQTVLQNIHEALEETGQQKNGNAKANAMSRFWGSQQRFFNQILTSMQMPSAIEAIKKDLKDGHAVVMQLVNTNEAAQNRQISKMEEGDSLEDLDLTPRDMLMQYIEKGFPTQQYEEYMDDNGNIRTRPVFDSQGRPVHNRQAVAMKEALLDKIGSMKVPEGPLEIIINTFGAENVAEITGRTRRIVRVKDGSGKLVAKKETRTPKHAEADANAFMDDKKKILVFSDAGGTGRSYHASLTAKNQRRRVHYLIQPGWRADNAVQGFGRTHRTNQANTPHYVLVTTNLKGQKRFISSIARRLDQLGALTKGQRQTGSQGLFSAKDNLESGYAKDALQRFYEDLVRGQIKGFNPQELLNKMGLDRMLDDQVNLKEAPELRDITKFLNRILALESSLQNDVFDAFSDRLDAIIERAIETGTLDVGLENFRADKVNVLDEKTVYTDEISGAETKYIELEASYKNKPLSYGRALKLSRLVGVYRNTRSGRVYAVRQRGMRTTQSGSVVYVYELHGQSEDNVNSIDKPKFDAGNWEEVKGEEAQKAWNEALDKLPEYRDQKVHLITGAILPIWDRLPAEQVRVIRVKTDDGRVMLGRIIPDRLIDTTLSRLNVQRNKQELSPAEIARRILEDNYYAELANGWRIVRKGVSGEYRIEIIGDDLYRFADQLKKDGVFTERIQFNTRYFIPSGEDAAGVFSKVTAHRPVVDVVSPDGLTYGAATNAGSLREKADAALQNANYREDLSETKEGLNEKIDNAIGDVKPPAGFSVKVVHSPQKTSIKQVAAGLRIGATKGIFKEGMTIVDVGGGLWEKGTEYLADKGIKNLVYDPYARSKEHNDNVIKTLNENGGADAAALNNVLNVIPTPEERVDVLKYLYHLLKPGAQAVVTVYEGNRSGKGAKRVFSDGTSTWQENRLLGTYEKEIREALPGAKLEKQFGAFVLTKREGGLAGTRERLNKKVDEAIGDVKPPAGLSIKIVGNKQRRQQPAGEYQIKDKEIRERFEAAKGAPKESLSSRVKEFMVNLWHMSTREYEHLPRTAKFAQLRNDLSKLAKQKGVRSDETLRLLQGITINLSKEQFNIFRHYVVLADLVEEMKAGHDLPFGFTEDTLTEEWERIQDAVKADPEVQQSIDDRKAVWDGIIDEYVEAQEKIGHHVEGKFTRRNYYRHQVLEYAQGKSITGTGKKLKTPSGRGFLKQREGSALDINTDYLQAEFEVMARMLYDIQLANTIDRVNKRDNIIDRLKARAKSANESMINGIIRREKGPAGDETSSTEMALKAYRQKIAVGFKNLRGLAEQGNLWEGENGEYADVVSQFAGESTPDVDDETGGRLFYYLSDLLGNNTDGSAAAGMILKAVSHRKIFVRELLGKNYKTWENSIPEGYVAWQPREGNLFFCADTVPAHMADQLYEQIISEMGIKAKDLNRVLVMGSRRPSYVLKEEIALTLDNLVKDQQLNPLLKPLADIQRAWKIWQLVSPRRWFKYNFRNLSGDAEAVFVGNPAAFKKVPQAFSELYPVFAANKPMTQNMRDWFERGGMETLLQAQELGDINSLKMFVSLEQKKGTAAELPTRAWQGYWKAARISTDFREAILRYASYLSYLEQMQNSPEGRPKNFGASIREETMALDDIKDRAFKLSNELLGAYDQVGVVGQGLRKYVMPFWSWNEVNFRRTKQLFFNAARDGGLARAAARKVLGTMVVKSPFLAWSIGKFTLKAAGLWVLLQLWNEWKWPEEEKSLPIDTRSRPHIIFGRDKDGKVLYFDRLGFVQDFLGWFGLDESPLVVRDWLNGKRTIKEIAVDMAKSPLNKLIGGLGPVLKTPAEIIWGKTIYPDAFKPRSIRDRWEYLANSLGLANEYKALAGKPVQTYGTGNRAEGYWRSWGESLIYKADPLQSSYYDILDEKYRFMRKKGKDNNASYYSPKSNALYNFKLSIRYKDKEAARKYLTEYAQLGGTSKGLEQSLKAMNPLNGLNKEEQVEFVKSLNSEDRAKLIRAIRYYETTLMGQKS